MTNGFDECPDSSAAAPSDRTACLADAAGRLRAVRQAHARFLALWAADHLMGAAAGAMAAADHLADTPDNRVNLCGLDRLLFRDRWVDDDR